MRRFDFSPIVVRMQMIDCLIAFGANEGDPEISLRRAAKSIEAIEGVESVVVSEPMVTMPVGGPSGQSSYLNAAMRIRTELQPEELHLRLIAVETELGRERRVRWGSRTIDLDLLIYGLETVQTLNLTVPHPRMSFRRFVLEPCQKIAGEMIHPTSGLTINQLLAHLDLRPNVIAWINPNQNLWQQLAVDDSTAGWTLAPVTTQEQFAGFEALAKLVVVCPSPEDESPTELENVAIEFAGPMLDLRKSDDPTSEILAAIAAM